MASVLALLLLGILGWLGAPTAMATQRQPTPARAASVGGSVVTPAPVPAPKAWVLVDADTGAVLDAGNDRQPLPPASLTKLLTALVAAQSLHPTDTLEVSARAAGEPARKIGMKQGEVWPFQDALYSMLLSSANDAAAAIGERIGGTLENFSTLLNAAGAQLGLQDHPLLQDPAGLDDNFSVNGGNLLSARDLAIIARAVLAQPTLATVVSTDIYRFVGPDGTHHRLLNHIHSFLEHYPGALGLKPGYTRKAGSGLVLAARRSGRTLISVVLDAPDTYASAIGLLDRGFAMSPDAATGDVLPPVHLPSSALAPVPAATPTSAPAITPAVGRATTRRHSVSLTNPAIALLAILPAGLAVSARRREIRRRRARRSQQMRRLQASGPPAVSARRRDSA